MAGHRRFTHADGSVTQSQFDAVGRLRAQTDAAGRTTEYSPDVVTGLITRITTPDGRASAFYYNHHEKDRITITDSLDRREVLHTQGEAGLKRVVKKEHADGSVTQSQFDAVGRLRAQTDAAGRTTEYSPDVVTGLITRITTPDGRASAFYTRGRQRHAESV